MSHLVVNLRGTHGSGKSTIVRTLLDRYRAEPLPAAGEPGRKPKVPGYRFRVPWLRDEVRVVGSYETACGGCDAVQPYALIWPRVVEYAAAGHVLFEGALVSSSYGNIGRASEEYGDRFVFAFLDTPLDECLRRVAARRAARGNNKPLDPRNTEVKYRNVLASIPKIRALGRRVVVLRHDRAVGQVLGILRSGEQCRKIA